MIRIPTPRSCGWCFTTTAMDSSPWPSWIAPATQAAAQAERIAAACRDGVDWDVFISYRSADRVWALALYDMLQQCGYRIFLDQYVLAAGSGVLAQLSQNLQRSASGVIIWSQRSVDSDWVEREVSAMVERKDATKKSATPFHFVAAKLDAEPLPALLAGNLYIDFSTYPDGPTGAELVRLTSGLQGAGLDPPAVERISAFEEEVRQEPSTLRGMANAGDFDGIKERALRDVPAYTTSATLPALAAQLLIAGGSNALAFAVLDCAQARFRRPPRGIALRPPPRRSPARRSRRRRASRSRRTADPCRSCGPARSFWRTRSPIASSPGAPADRGRSTVR